MWVGVVGDPMMDAHQPFMCITLDAKPSFPRPMTHVLELEVFFLLCGQSCVKVVNDATTCTKNPEH